MTRWSRATTAAFTVYLGAGVVAQAPPRTAFTATSVKVNRLGGALSPYQLGFLSGGRFVATNVTLQQLIAAAYGVHQLLPPNRMVGGPTWLANDRFDVAAKTDDPDAAREVDGVPRRSLMLRALLSDRFRLLVHSESRTLPVYALVLARSDKLGPRIRASAMDCAAIRARADASTTPPPPLPNERPSCGIGSRGYSLIGGGATMSQLANVLSARADRVVVDRTSLEGVYDLDLSWVPPPQAVTPPPGVPPSDPEAIAALLTALQEQLGLKLESARGPVDLLVIDRADHPSAN